MEPPELPPVEPPELPPSEALLSVVSVVVEHLLAEPKKSPSPQSGDQATKAPRAIKPIKNNLRYVIMSLLQIGGENQHPCFLGS